MCVVPCSSLWWRSVKWIKQVGAIVLIQVTIYCFLFNWRPLSWEIKWKNKSHETLKLSISTEQWLALSLSLSHSLHRNIPCNWLRTSFIIRRWMADTCSLYAFSANVSCRHPRGVQCLKFSRHWRRRWTRNRQMVFYFHSPQCQPPRRLSTLCLQLAPSDGDLRRTVVVAVVGGVEDHTF